MQVYENAITMLNEGKFDAALAEYESHYCPLVQVTYEKIVSGGKKSKTELSIRKAEMRSDRAQKLSHVALEKQMGKIVGHATVIDNEAIEEGSTFGKILTPVYMDTVKEKNIYKWSDLVHALLPATATSNLHGGNHNLIVLYEVAHARAVRTSDLQDSGILASLTTNMETSNAIQEVLQEKDFEMLSLVCNYSQIIIYYY